MRKLGKRVGAPRALKALALWRRRSGRGAPGAARVGARAAGAAGAQRRKEQRLRRAGGGEQAARVLVARAVDGADVQLGAPQAARGVEPRGRGAVARAVGRGAELLLFFAVVCACGEGRRSACGRSKGQ